MESSQPFPDTPRWSLRRWCMILALFAAGGAMVAIGSCPIVDETRGLKLIEFGTECMKYSALGFAFAASAERVGGWFSIGRGAPS